MRNRTASISGPLTDDDLRRIFELLKQIEARNPDGVYRIAIDDPESRMNAIEMQRKIEELNLQPAGYERRWYHGKRRDG